MLNTWTEVKSLHFIHLIVELKSFSNEKGVFKVQKGEEKGFRFISSPSNSINISQG